MFWYFSDFGLYNNTQFSWQFYFVLVHLSTILTPHSSKPRAESPKVWNCSLWANKVSGAWGNGVSASAFIFLTQNITKYNGNNSNYNTNKPTNNTWHLVALSPSSMKPVNCWSKVPCPFQVQLSSYFSKGLLWISSPPAPGLPLIPA